MKKRDLSTFYGSPERLAYNPCLNMNKKRRGIKKLIAFDDRFEEVKKELRSLILRLSSYPIKVMDIGVGDGIYEASLEKEIKKRAEFYGVDVSMKQMNRAKKYLKEVKVVDIDSEKLPYKNSSFDIVILSEVLEHIFFPEKILAEILRVLKRNGYVILTFPNASCLQLRLGLLLRGSSPLLNYSTNKEHIRFFSSYDINKLLDGNYKLLYKTGLSSFLFDKWNFFLKIPMPRLVQIVGNKILPNLALGILMILQKND